MLGHVYFIAAPKSNAVKIGMTSGESPSARLSSIQTGHHEELQLIHSISCVSIAPAIVERDLHRAFGAYRIRENGEWFSLSGLLAAFLGLCKDSDRYDHAHSHGTVSKNSGRWQFSIGGCVQNKTGGNCPIRAAVSHIKLNPGDAKGATIAGLEAMLEEAMGVIAELHSLVEPARRMSEIFIESHRELESDMMRRANPASLELYSRIRKSKYQRLLMDCAYESMSNKDELMGSSLFPPI